jgi:hypothetical protein
MNVLLSALHRGWQQCCDALHPDPHPTLIEALRDTYLATAHTVTQFTHDAERMEYPQFRARLLRMAAEEQGHVTWLRDTILARGGAIPTRVCPPAVAPTSWAALLSHLAAERRASEALLEPVHLAEQDDPELAEGFRRLRAAKQQHREVLLDMLVKSDPYTLGAGPIAGASSGRPGRLGSGARIGSETALYGRATGRSGPAATRRQRPGARRGRRVTAWKSPSGKWMILRVEDHGASGLLPSWVAWASRSAGAHPTRHRGGAP